MPRYKGPAKHFNGEALDKLEGIGHGRRILFADPSLDYPAHTEEVIETRARTSAMALFHYAQMAYLEERPGDRRVEVTCMAPDPGDDSPLAQIAIERFRAIAFEPFTDVEGREVDITLREVPRHSVGRRLGFYALIADTTQRLIVVRSSSASPYDCAYVDSGHAQVGEPEVDEFDVQLNRFRYAQQGLTERNSGVS